MATDPSSWHHHWVRRIDDTRYVDSPAQRRILTEGRNRVFGMPYLVYMPERDRVFMVVYLDYGPCKPASLFSDDHGDIWSEPAYIKTDPKLNPDFGDTPTALSYLGNGKLMFSGCEERWASADFGATWQALPLPPGANGKPWAGWQWEPYLIDRNPQTGRVIRIAETAYSHEGDEYPTWGYYSQAYIRFSTNEGRTWDTEITVPQWKGINEVGLCRAQNGDIIATCRTDISQWFRDPAHRPDGMHPPDLYSGFGISISKDNGMTWSNVNVLFDVGRHFASMVLMSNGDLIMTYMVRVGYPCNVDGFPTYGIEAIVSRDNGVTWKTAHRIILDEWTGNQRGHNAWWASPQSTSTVLLPDGSLLTAYGRAYHCLPTEDGKIGPPRDIGFVRWRLPA